MNPHKNESPTTGRGSQAFKTASLTRVVKWSRFTSSKQLQPAMTFQVYTKSIKRRNPIGKTYALVSPKHCEYVPLIGGSTSKKPNQSCCTNRVTPRTTRQPNWNHVEWAPLVHHTVDTMMERAVRMTGEKK